MTEKPKAAEEEYFAREEALKLQRLHHEKLKAEDAADRKKRKEAHWMKCPKCGWDLETLRWRSVEIDKCFQCGVIVLDDGELEKLAGKEHEEGWITSVFGLFKS